MALPARGPGAAQPKRSARHEAVLDALTQIISGIDPVCSIYAGGSVGRGTHGPDSDIDLFVITWRVERTLFDGDGGLEVMLDSGTFRGIRVDLHCRSLRNHTALIMGGPVYAWGPVRILYDPSGIAQWGAECTERLLSDNPALCAKLRRFHDLHQQWKRDKTTVREFGRSIDTAALIRRYPDFVSWSSRSPATRTEESSI